MSKRATTEPRSIGALHPRRQGRIASIVKELESVGPNMTEIAKRLGEPKESVNYVFRSIVEKKGFALQARVNLAALGLREAVAERSTTYLSDSDYSRGYSPSRYLLDDSKGEWVFDLDEEMELPEVWREGAPRVAVPPRPLELSSSSRRGRFLRLPRCCRSKARHVSRSCRDNRAP